MMNAVNSIENTSEQCLHRGEEGMDNFCLKLNEIRAEIEEMMKYNEPKMPHIAVSAVITSNQLVRIKKMSQITERLETIATLQVDIEVAPIQFVIWIGATSILKYQSFFTMLEIMIFIS